MPVIRGHHSFDDHFTQIPNQWLRDNRLSFKARGLLSLIMSHTQGWHLTIARLAEDNKEGRDSIRAAIAELEELGYLTRSQENNGRFGEVTWTTRDPSENPSSENPATENPTPKKNINKEEQVLKNHAHLEKHFDEFWNAYPRKLDKAKAFRAFKSAMNRAKFEDILAGVIAYRNDPKRNPDFTKYPATWLNSDAWENAAALPDTAVAERREKERARTREYLEQIQQAEAQAASEPPKCEHGKNVALCRICL